MDKILILRSLLFLLMINFLGTANVYAAEEDEAWYSFGDWFTDDPLQRVVIAEPFIEFRTGPGRGFPVFHIEERNVEVEIIKKKTQWYKIRAPRGQEGWVHEDTMEKTLLGDGENFDASNTRKEDFKFRTGEAGVLGGEFGGATSLTLYTGWHWTQNITAELSVSQALGNVSDIRHASVNLLHEPFPEWRVSPFFRLGAGVIQTKPFTTLVQTEDRTDEIVNVGFGVKAYVSRQFFIRAEYSSYTILTSRNDNDEVEEWKLGFSVFF